MGEEQQAIKKQITMKESIVAKFVKKIKENPKVYRLVTQEAKLRGIMQDSINGDLPAYKQRFVYYEN